MNDYFPITDVYRDVIFIPARVAPRFTTLITIHPGVSAYHLNELIAHNNDADVYVISDTRASMEGRCDSFKWKNCDVLLREWWINNREKIKTEKILVMEYDVLVTTKITDSMFTDGVRVLGNFDLFTGFDPNVSWHDAPWWWSKDGDKLSVELKSSAASCPVTTLFYNRYALDFLILKTWDEVFSKDIICEIRLPTILNFHKVPLYKWDVNDGFKRNNNLDIAPEEEAFERIKNNQPGIYHPVKSPL